MNKKTQLIVKRIIDIFVSISILLLFLPAWVLIALLIKLTSKGPIFFIQDRPGKDKILFRIYKFRSMKLGSEKMIKDKEVMYDDPRITNIGKFLRRTKMDEIPQFINILKGEMSLVGPRPERISSLKYYNDEISKRLIMKPGITGLAQVSGNIYLSLKTRYKYDIYYVENFTLILDIRIFLRTIFVIILGEKKFENNPLIRL